MNEQITIQPNRFASQWRWFAPAIWLLVALAALTIFVRGVPVFVEKLRGTYSTNFGFWVQRNSNDELFMVPDINGQAARAGVLERDVLLAVDGQPIGGDEVTALEQIMPAGAPGTAVTLQLRTGQRPVREITLIRGDHAGAWLHRFHIPLAAVIGLAVGIELLVTLGFITSAAFIFWRRSQTVAVWLSSLVLILFFASAGSLPVQSLYFAELAWQYGLDIWFSLIVAGLILFLFLFPNGRFIPRWSIILLPLCLLWVVAAWIWPELYFWRLAPQRYLPTMVVILLVGLLAQLWRFRLVSDEQQRQQTKWVAWGTGVALTAVFIQLATGQLLPDSPLLFDLLINPLTRLLQLLIPVTLALAIVRHRLWDINIILNRTLVYGGLTVLITAVYVLLVGGMGTLAANQPGQLIGLALATAVVVAGIRPLRTKWQTAVNRIIPLPTNSPPQPARREYQNRETAVSHHNAKRWLAWFSLALALLLWAASRGATALSTDLLLNDWFFAFITPAYLFVGTLVVVHRPSNRIGRLCLLIGWLLIPAQVGVEQRAMLPYFNLEPLLPFAIRISLTLMQIIVMLMFVYLPLLFPNGQYLSENWRRFGKWLAILMAFPILLTLIQPGNIFDWGEGQALNIVNPLAINWPLLADIPQLTLLYVWAIPTLLAILVAIGSLILRWRQSDRPTRQQIKWVVYFLSTLVALFMLIELMFWLFGPSLRNTAVFPLIEFTFDSLAVIVWVGFPLVIGLAVLKYRLYDIDVIINRTLVYGGLSLGIVAVYVLVVGALGTLFQAQGNVFFALLATGLIAVLFQPVRERLQHAANRLMFGERDDPYKALSKLSAQLQTTSTPEATLQSVVETIAATLKLPYVAIDLADEQGQLGGAATGTAVAETVTMPLHYQNETVGQLVVSPRSPGESFTEREQRLLTDMAAQTGAMAYSVRLTAALQRTAADLQQSREKLVLTREEERRRIRRDLHDGLGPTLASQTFAFDAILDLMETNPAEAARLLHGLKSQNQETVAEIRRLVYALRPPALDELGLIGALQAHVGQINSHATLPIQISADPDPLPPLSAAVEVAAYRITLEAITNVVRHAQAQRCSVCLRVVENGRFGALSADRSHLRVEVSDDGIGLLPDRLPGVGLNSMRERAEELGGSLAVSNEGEGVRVTAVLPM